MRTHIPLEVVIALLGVSSSDRWEATDTASPVAVGDMGTHDTDGDDSGAAPGAQAPGAGSVSGESQVADGVRR